MPDASSASPSWEERLGQAAIRRGYLTPTQLDRLRQDGDGLRLDQLLLREGLVSAETLAELLHEVGPTDVADLGEIGRARYRVCRLIGRGGMGAVYEAEDPELKRPVALKIVREDEMGPDAAVRLHREAATHERAGRLNESAAEYRKALGLDSGSASAFTGDLRLRKRLRDREEASHRVEQARPLLETARGYLYRKDVNGAEVMERAERARAILEKSVGLCADLPTAHYLLGSAWELLGWWDRAEASWRRAIEIDPRSGPAHYQLGWILVATGMLEEMQKRKERARELLVEGLHELEAAMQEGSGFDDELLRDVAVALIAHAKGQEERFEASIQESMKRHGLRDGVEELLRLEARHGSRDRGLARLNRALEIRPKYPLALFDRFTVHLRLGNKDAAIADLDAALEIHPRFHQAHVSRALFRMDASDLEGALRDLLRAVEISPKYAPAYGCLGMAYGRLGKMDAAFEACATALRIDSRCADGYHARGLLHQQQGDLVSALADFNRTLEVNPDLGVAYRSRGIVHRRLKRSDEAVSDLTRAIEWGPELATSGLYLERAVAYSQSGRPELARQDCSKALDLDSNNAMAYAQRGMVLIGLQEYESASADFDQALQLRPSDDYHYSNRGLARLYLRRFSEAAQDFTKAISLRPDVGLHYRLRAQAREGAGDRPSAAEDARKALQLELTSEGRKEVEALLHRMGETP